MNFYKISLEYKTLILLLGTLYSALILMILISLSIYENNLYKEHGKNLDVVFSSIKQVKSEQLNSSFLNRCEKSCKSRYDLNCILCDFREKFSSLDLEYYSSKERVPEKTISRSLTLDDGSTILLSISEEYIKEKMSDLRDYFIIVFLSVSVVFTSIVIFLNRKLFYPLKCLINLCNDTTEQNDSVSYCPCSWEIKDLRDAITKLLTKNQSLYEKKSDMFKEIAHEMKSPIAIMQARLSLLSVDNSAANVEKYIKATDEDIDDIKNIIYELLFLEEIEMDIQNTHKSEISMKDECELMQEKFGPILELNDVSVNAPWDDDFHIYSFKHSMRKVMQAVYENVFIHTKKGSTIDVKVDAKKKAIIITNESKPADDNSFKSTNIGTKIIKRLSEKLGFTFETNLKDNIHTTTLTFHS